MLRLVRMSAAPRGTRFPTPTASALLLVIAFTACDDSTAPDRLPDGQAQLVFVSDRGGETSEAGVHLVDLYRVNADGSGMENLTQAPAQAYYPPALSPDGTRLLFESDRSGCYNVWTMETDGSDATQLTGNDPSERCNENPRWSPDGSMIAFTTSREPIDQSWEVYVMNADGTDQHNVSGNAGLEASSLDWTHGWTPDGRVIFHSYMPDQSPNTLLVNPDGTGLEPVFENPGSWAPFWSPDGEKVAFVTDRDGNAEVYVINADGTGEMNISNDAGHDSFSAWITAVGSWADPWSPDGTRLAFVSTRDGNLNIYVVNADGTGLTPITDTGDNNTFNGWSPDGSRIAFSSDRTGDWDVYTVNPDGTDLVNVTDDPAKDRYAVWLR